ncbi:hypothetical protein [Streptomyces sp. NPDC090445]|uniref:hypothetical protein n=1 Tax=Streptomyces sp. NPDC090445 TaxID=3365963 RepID=UPI00380D9B37
MEAQNRATVHSASTATAPAAGPHRFDLQGAVPDRELPARLLFDDTPQPGHELLRAGLADDSELLGDVPAAGQEDEPSRAAGAGDRPFHQAQPVVLRCRGLRDEPVGVCGAHAADGGGRREAEEADEADGIGSMRGLVENAVDPQAGDREADPADRLVDGPGWIFG